MKIPKIIYKLSCVMVASTIIDVILLFAEGGLTINVGWLLRLLVSVAAWYVVIKADVKAKWKVLHVAIGAVVILAVSALIVLATLIGFVVLSF